MFVSGACQNFREPTQCFSGTGKYPKYCNQTIMSPAHVPWDEVKLLTKEPKVLGERASPSVKNKFFFNVGPP